MFTELPPQRRRAVPWFRHTPLPVAIKTLDQNHTRRTEKAPCWSAPVPVQCRGEDTFAAKMAYALPQQLPCKCGFCGSDGCNSCNRNNKGPTPRQPQIRSVSTLAMTLMIPLFAIIVLLSIQIRIADAAFSCGSFTTPGKIQSVYYFRLCCTGDRLSTVLYLVTVVLHLRFNFLNDRFR